MKSDSGEWCKNFLPLLDPIAFEANEEEISRAIFTKQWISKSYSNEEIVTKEFGNLCHSTWLLNHRRKSHGLSVGVKSRNLWSFGHATSLFLDTPCPKLRRQRTAVPPTIWRPRISKMLAKQRWKCAKATSLFKASIPCEKNQIF